MLKSGKTATVLDRLYEHIHLPGELVACMDTPYFQRLRGLKQLGVTNHLYPGATHTRFEHSIGVGHLSGVMIDNIASRQGDQLKITHDDQIKVMLAGLTHDLGHGPFSHLFEDVVVNQLGVGKFNHELMSEALFKRMFLEVEGAEKKPTLKGMLNQSEVEDVLSLISGARCATTYPNSTLVKDQSKSWMYEIVANKRNGIDVDKIDYLVRDALCCFGKHSSDVHANRIFSSTRVIDLPETGDRTIAYASKMSLGLRDLFALRAKLHKSVYQHRICKSVGHMVGDVFRSAATFAKPGVVIPTSEVGKPLAKDQMAFPLIHGSNVTNPDSFATLGDWLIESMDACPELATSEAKRILSRLHTRNLYPLVFEATINIPEHKKQEKEHPILNGSNLVKELNKFIIENETKKAMAVVTDPGVARRPVLLEIFSIHHGMKSADPLDRVKFYSKSSKDALLPASAIQTSQLFQPGEFEEKSLVIFAREAEKGSTAQREELTEVKKLVHEFMKSSPEWMGCLKTIAH